eukprot:4807113-Prymnesium_polylepis.1
MRRGVSALGARGVDALASWCECAQHAGTHTVGGSVRCTWRAPPSSSERVRLMGLKLTARGTVALLSLIVSA